MQGNENRFQNTGSVTLKANSQIRVGLITTTGTSKPKLSNCSVISKVSHYWHVYLNWQPLFIDNRRVNNFFVGKKSITGIIYQTLNVRLLFMYVLLLRFATFSKSYFGIGVLLYICCIFSEHFFLRKPLEGCFCHFETGIKWKSKIFEIQENYLKHFGFCFTASWKASFNSSIFKRNQ